MTGPLDAYFAARVGRESAAVRKSDAVEHLRHASEVEREARYQAVTAVLCPFCGAGPGEPCINPPGVTLHHYVTHGIRDDASGVNGARHRST